MAQVCRRLLRLQEPILAFYGEYVTVERLGIDKGLIEEDQDEEDRHDGAQDA